MLDSSTIAQPQCVQGRSPGWSSAWGSEPLPPCSIAAAQLAQQYVMSPCTRRVVGPTIATPQWAQGAASRAITNLLPDGGLARPRRPQSLRVLHPNQAVPQPV